MGLHFSGQSTGHRRGTVNDFVTNVKNRVKKYSEKTDVYLVFNRYDDFSTKSVARGGRETGVMRTHQLRIETKLPAQNVVLIVVENKKQLISIIFGELIRDRLFHVECTKGTLNMDVTGKQPCPVQISSEEVKRDMTWRLTLRKPTTSSFSKF